MTEANGAVFLSYTSKDVDAARRICESLRSAGIEVWLDESELRGGDAWDAAIRKQIKTWALFMPVIAANASARMEGYFRLEWKLAVDRSHLIAAERAFILPVVIDATRDVDALVPDKFREVQWIPARRQPGLPGNHPAHGVPRVGQIGVAPSASTMAEQGAPSSFIYRPVAPVGQAIKPAFSSRKPLVSLGTCTATCVK